MIEGIHLRGRTEGEDEHEGKGRMSDGIDASQVRVDKLANGLSKQLLTQTTIPRVEVESKLTLAVAVILISLT